MVALGWKAQSTRSIMAYREGREGNESGSIGAERGPGQAGGDAACTGHSARLTHWQHRRAAGGEGCRHALGAVTLPDLACWAVRGSADNIGLGVGRGRTGGQLAIHPGAAARASPASADKVHISAGAGRRGRIPGNR